MEGVMNMAFSCTWGNFRDESCVGSNIWQMQKHSLPHRLIRVQAYVAGYVCVCQIFDPTHDSSRKLPQVQKQAILMTPSIPKTALFRYLASDSLPRCTAVRQTICQAIFLVSGSWSLARTRHHQKTPHRQERPITRCPDYKALFAMKSAWGRSSAWYKKVACQMGFVKSIRTGTRLSNGVTSFFGR